MSNLPYIQQNTRHSQIHLNLVGKKYRRGDDLPTPVLRLANQSRSEEAFYRFMSSCKKLLVELGRLPSRTEIAKHAKMHSQTVAKHIKDPIFQGWLKRLTGISGVFLVNLEHREHLELSSSKKNNNKKRLEGAVKGRGEVIPFDPEKTREMIAKSKSAYQEGLLRAQARQLETTPEAILKAKGELLNFRHRINQAIEERGVIKHVES